MPLRRAGSRPAQGFALPLVLWLCALLAVVGTTVLLTARADAIVTRQRTELARARAAADAGVALAVLALSGAAASEPWPRDGRPVPARFGGAALLVSVQDELGLIDVNFASAELLAGLFRSLGAEGAASRSAAQAIVGWREPQAGARRRLVEVDELVRVPGLPPDLLRRALPYLTVRNGSAAIDPVSAPAPVLRSLLPSWDADRMVATRREAAVLPGSLPLLNDADLQGPPPHRFAVIRVEGQVASGTRFVREAEVELQPDPQTVYRILSWRQAADAEPAS